MTSTLWIGGIFPGPRPNCTRAHPELQCVPDAKLRSWIIDNTILTLITRTHIVSQVKSSAQSVNTSSSFHTWLTVWIGGVLAGAWPICTRAHLSLSMSFSPFLLAIFSCISYCTLVLDQNLVLMKYLRNNHHPQITSRCKQAWHV